MTTASDWQRTENRRFFIFGVLAMLAAIVLFALVILAGIGVRTLQDEHDARVQAEIQACQDNVFTDC